MNFLYVLGGIACVLFGVWIVIKQIKTFAKGEQDKLGFSIQLLFGGIMALILGVGLIAHYI